MKIQSLQILRAIAAWLVVYHHYMQLFYDFKSETFLGFFFSEFGSFGVDIFFVLSGFVMFNSANSKSSTGWSFFVKRVFRVFPAYWFFSLLLIIFSFLMPQEFNFTAYTLKSLFYSLLFIPHENPSGIGLFPYLTVGWTLNYEILFYSVLALCLFLTKRYAVYICGIIVISFPLILFKNESIIFSALSSVLMWQFVCGLIVGWLHLKFNLFNVLNPVSAIALIMLSTITASGFLGDGIMLKSASASMLVVAFIALNNILDEKSKTLSFLAKLGDYSYSTYLCHIFVIGLALHIFGSELNFTSEIVILFTISALTYIASLLSYTFIETSKTVSTIRDSLIKPKNNM